MNFVSTFCYKLLSFSQFQIMDEKLVFKDTASPRTDTGVKEPRSPGGSLSRSSRGSRSSVGSQEGKTEWITATKESKRWILSHHYPRAIVTHLGYNKYPDWDPCIPRRVSMYPNRGNLWATNKTSSFYIVWCLKISQLLAFKYGEIHYSCLRQSYCVS